MVDKGLSQGKRGRVGQKKSKDTLPLTVREKGNHYVSEGGSFEETVSKRLGSRPQGRVSAQCPSGVRGVMRKARVPYKNTGNLRRPGWHLCESVSWERKGKSISNTERFSSSPVNLPCEAWGKNLDGTNSKEILKGSRRCLEPREEGPGRGAEREKKKSGRERDGQIWESP